MGKTVSRNKMRLIITLVFITSLSAISITPSIIFSEINQPIANLVLETYGGGVRPDYGLYIAMYLREIGIDVEVKVQEWSWPWDPWSLNDWDLGIVGISGGGASPDMRELYTEDGTLNIFRLGPDLPYGNQSEQMQDLGVTITDLEVRQQLYYDWQQLMMDKIVPMLPLYSPNSYSVTWANTLGYDARWGIVNCLPYMSYDGYHEGQVSLNEFNLADANWRELNPLFTDDTSSSFIWSLMAEPILQFSPDLAPVKNGLIDNWEKIDDFHFKFYMRDEVYWNPSFNVTGRTSGSSPLNSSDINQLMVGLKGNYSNGTNQQVTAKDAVFTFLCWGNQAVSEETIGHEWISDCYVDPFDPLAFHIHIDGIPETAEPDYYVDFWSRMTSSILPEFFLNSTLLEITYTESGIECKGLYSQIINTDQWLAFSTSAFGCGKYMLDYYIQNSITVLKQSPYWFGVGAFDGQAGLVPFVETINVRVIPDTSAELMEFKAGKLDWTRITAFPAERKNMETDPRFTVYQKLSNSLTFMAFNLRRPFIGGVDNFIFMETEGKEDYTRAVGIRKAICYAINRDEMNQILHDGEYLVAHSVLYPYTSYYYYNDIIKYDYNPELAEEWLRDSYGLPEYSFNILNAEASDKDITIQFNCSGDLGIDPVVLFYEQNDEGFNSSSMIKESESIYSLNIGSEFTNGTKIEYYVEYTNIYNESKRTPTRSFIIDFIPNIDTNSFITIDSYSIIIMSAVITVVSISLKKFRKRSKK